MREDREPHREGLHDVIVAVAGSNPSFVCATSGLRW